MHQFAVRDKVSVGVVRKRVIQDKIELYNQVDTIIYLTDINAIARTKEIFGNDNPNNNDSVVKSN